MSLSSWLLPAYPLILRQDEVHVWRVELEASPTAMVRQAQNLDRGEYLRASRFHFAKDRARFIAAHCALRVILGGYLNVDPAALVFATTSSGKPFIDSPSQRGPDTLTFNLSHSHDLALVGVSRGHGIGVDLERLRPEWATESVAEQFFAPQEVAALRTVAPEARAEAFYNCWTRKEALVKAHGAGLTLPLDRFTVSLTPDEPATLLDVADELIGAGRWRLWTLEPGPGYTAALAADFPECRVTAFRYSATAPPQMTTRFSRRLSGGSWLQRPRKS